MPWWSLPVLKKKLVSREGTIVMYLTNTNMFSCIKKMKSFQEQDDTDLPLKKIRFDSGGIFQLYGVFDASPLPPYH